jgi:hypothetical protein
MTQITRTVWRIYCLADNVNREFGRDYTRAEAIRVAKEWRRMHPNFRYRVRKVEIRR